MFFRFIESLIDYGKLEIIDWDDRSYIFGSSKPEKIRSTSKISTPILDGFGRDLTQYAIENKLDPIVGRIKEIERVSQILSRRKKKNPILACLDYVLLLFQNL